jgi:hypothetical protein
VLHLRWVEFISITGGCVAVSTVEAAVAAKELRRWIAWLGGSLVAASFFTALALAGLSPWMILPAILVGPGLGGIALIWLALSSDTNAIAHVLAEPVVEAEAIAA